MGLLTTVFIVLFILKVANLVTWSWWIITSPLWFAPLLIILLFVITVAEEILTLFITTLLGGE